MLLENQTWERKAINSRKKLKMCGIILAGLQRLAELANALRRDWECQIGRGVWRYGHVVEHLIARFVPIRLDYAVGRIEGRLYEGQAQGELWSEEEMFIAGVSFVG